MPHIAAQPSPDLALPDEEVIRRVKAGEPALFEVVMRRYNPRVYRTIRSFLKDEAECEDAMQQAYLQAYTHLSDFNGDAAFSTWLLRIAANEALMRIRKNSKLTLVADPPELEILPMSQPDPEERAERREWATLLEQAVDALPDLYRSVFVLRELEDLSTADAARVLGVTEDSVKTRLHRARGLVREALYARVGKSAEEAFPFHAPRCDRVVNAVLARIAAA